MTHIEKCGDSLIEIYSTYSDHDSEDVVRWCTKCGAIVVDIDYDGRTKPGAIMEMRFPTNGKMRIL